MHVVIEQDISARSAVSEDLILHAVAVAGWRDPMSMDLSLGHLPLRPGGSAQSDRNNVGIAVVRADARAQFGDSLNGGKLCQGVVGPPQKHPDAGRQIVRDIAALRDGETAEP